MSVEIDPRGGLGENRLHDDFRGLRLGGGWIFDDDDRLEDSKIELIHRWVKTGAAAKEQVGAVRPVSLISAKELYYLEFQPPVKHPPPKVAGSGRVRSPIDAFILEKLERKVLILSLDSTQVELLRHASFAPIGLPPSPLSS